MATLREKLYSDIELAVSMEAAELAKLVIAEIPRFVQNGIFHPTSLIDSVVDGGLPHDGLRQLNIPDRKRLKMALSATFSWLETNGLLAPAPDINGAHGFKALTTKGEKLSKSPNFDEFEAKKQFPASTLHEKLRGQIWNAAIRGEFDSAVLQAFKLLEERVRKAGNFANADIGVKLMRAAFHAPNGPLTDRSQAPGEQQGVADLFAGASGAFRNPSAHRT